MNRKERVPESEANQLSDEESSGNAELTAFALDQLSTDEAEVIKTRLDDNRPALNALDEIRTLAVLLRESEDADVTEASDVVRTTLQCHLDNVEQHDNIVARRAESARKWNSRRWLLVASVASAIVLVLVAVQQRDDPLPTRTFAVKPDHPRNAATTSHNSTVPLHPADQHAATLEELVDQFDKLLDEQRYAEAEMIARQATQLDPNSAVALNLRWKSRFIHRIQSQQAADSSKNGVRDSIDESSVPMDDRSPIVFNTSSSASDRAASLTEGQVGWERLSVSRMSLSRDGDRLCDPRKTPLHGGPRAGEEYGTIHENGFVVVGPATALSTFSIDVDTAAYANVRRFLTHDALPPADAVRIEELVNYFQYDYPQPDGRHPFSINMEVAGCPWKTGHLLLRIGLQGKEIDTDKRPASNLVFLLDVSGSMQAGDKLPLLKQALKMLVERLTENDRVTLVTYAGQAGLQLDTTTGDRKAEINAAIESLHASGSTNGSAGIELAYRKAVQNYIEGGTNRVILATDGDLNVGISDNEQLVQLITEKARSGVFLTVLGFGTGNLKDAKLEQLADHGNGLYGYIDSLREARKVLVEQMTGSLVTIAKDVKAQVEFNPAEVHAYRLIGYENRVMADQDFHDDAKDAGEFGAGQSVTVLYELEPTAKSTSTSVRDLRAGKTRLKYQQKAMPEIDARELTDAAESGELLTLSLRYKLPERNESSLIEVPLSGKAGSFEGASDDFRFAATVAAFGMLLRDSPYCGQLSFHAVEAWAGNAMGDDSHGRRAEFVDLVRRAGSKRAE